jgi:ubiquinol-cytochrome c reductase cytochrome b subunit
MSEGESERPQPYQHAEYPEHETIPFFPNYIILEVIVSYLLLAIIIVLATILPAGLEEKADPFLTPEHIKPEWYFLWIYQFVKLPSMVVGSGLLAELLGIFIPAVGIALLILLPFLDRNPERRPLRRRVAMAVAVLIIAILIGLSIWGWYS